MCVLLNSKKTDYNKDVRPTLYTVHYYADCILLPKASCPWFSSHSYKINSFNKLMWQKQQPALLVSL